MHTTLPSLLRLARAVAPALALALTACASTQAPEPAPAPAPAPAARPNTPRPTKTRYNTAGLCPIELPRTSLGVEQHGARRIFVTTTTDVHHLEALRARARELAARGFYTPATTADATPVSVRLVNIPDGVRIELEARDREAARHLRRQIDADRGYLMSGSC